MKVDLTPVLRFFEHLPRGADPDLALLKCHLLCEEVLTKSIERQLRNPKTLPKTRLSFSQKTHLARCLYCEKQDEWIWVALKKLNDARNELAHGLTRQNIEDEIEAFTVFVETQQGAPSPHVATPPFGRFQWAAFRVFARLAAWAHYDPTLQIPSGPSDAA